MKNTLRKITASLAAAVLCAVPMTSSLSANAEANANARNTFRRIWFIDDSANVVKFVFSFSCKKANTSAPSYTILKGTVTGNGGSAGTQYYNCGANVERSAGLYGPVCFASAYCNSPSDFVEGSLVANAYKAGNVQSFNSVHSYKFLVGDINNDNVVNAKDYDYMCYAINNGFTGSYSYTQSVTGTLGGSYFSYAKYKFDINGDGYVTSADRTMLANYNNGSLTRFAK